MTNRENEKIDSIRHSLAHLLAMAVLKKFPNAKLGIGPAIENGFYYDFELPSQISDADLVTIESDMKSILKKWEIFESVPVSKKDAARIFKNKSPFKLELINEISKKGENITVYFSGREGTVPSIDGMAENDNQRWGDDGFFDLCRGGHVSNTSGINPDAFKLTKIAGAYWKGDQKNKQLTRIYGIAFKTKEELEHHLRTQEEAMKRDHRVLGKDLELFSIIDEIGPGLPLFYPKGVILRNNVENYIEEIQKKRGYKQIWIPHITKGELYKLSGHLDKYDALYPPMKLKGESDYYLKPMNCPHFMMLYKTKPHSYKELPVRWTSTTTNYRYEKSGELTGLTRVRSLTQDDCHVFLLPEQIESEINLMLDMIAEVYDAFGFRDFWVRISTRDPHKTKKYIGDPAIWKNSEEILQRLIQNRGWKNELGEGEAAFYGPKLDFIFKDVLSREWQLSTIQLDMNLPQRFGLEYVDSEGSKKQPVVLHRAILGSTERFLGILIEHCAGEFPFWLAPVQVAILSINDRVLPYCGDIVRKLERDGIRSMIDSRNESIGKKIREAELQKIPYLLIIGDKETESNIVSVRERKKGDIGKMALGEFIEHIKAAAIT